MDHRFGRALLQLCRHVGFGSGGFNPNNNFSLVGFDWRDVYSVALGVQRQVGERLFLRMGYCYNDNPITSEAAQFNVASPLITQHTIHMGGSYMFAEAALLAGLRTRLRE